MTTKIKFVAALAALTVAATFALPAKEAEARRWGGGGLALGLIGGAIAGAAIANAATPVYYDGYGYRRCRWVSNYDYNGFYVGKSKVCRY
jgi:hypothetical protein